MSFSYSRGTRPDRQRRRAVAGLVGVPTPTSYICSRSEFSRDTRGHYGPPPAAFKAERASAPALRCLLTPTARVRQRVDFSRFFTPAPFGRSVCHFRSCCPFAWRSRYIPSHLQSLEAITVRPEDAPSCSLIVIPSLGDAGFECVRHARCGHASRCKLGARCWQRPGVPNPHLPRNKEPPGPRLCSDRSLDPSSPRARAHP